MTTFRDAKGNSWELSITIGSAMEVRARLAIDLLSPEQGDPPLLTQLGTDELLLGEVIGALLEEQLEARDMDASDVYRLFDGATMLAAQNVFYQELIDFFQSRGRNDRAKAVATQQRLIQTAIAAAEKKVDTINVDKVVSGAMSGNWPASSESILGR